MRDLNIHAGFLRHNGASPYRYMVKLYSMFLTSMRKFALYNDPYTMVGICECKEPVDNSLHWKNKRNRGRAVSRKEEDRDEDPLVVTLEQTGSADAVLEQVDGPQGKGEPDKDKGKRRASEPKEEEEEEEICFHANGNVTRRMVKKLKK